MIEQLHFLRGKHYFSLLRSIQNIMYRNPTQQNNYHMIIRLIDDRPVVIIPTNSQNQSTSFQKLISLDSTTIPKRILPQVFQTAKQLNTSQPFYTRRKSFSCQINAFNGSNKLARTQETKYGELKKTKDSLGADKTKISTVSEVCALNLDNQTLAIRSEHFNGLESIECIQSKSIHEGDSYDFQEADSEVISLTNEEKLFFQNFIEPQIEQNRGIQELFKQLSIQSISTMPQKVSEATALPQNKLKVIRNFFKPKEAIIKDQRTSLVYRLLKEQENYSREIDIKTGPQNQPIRKL